MFASLFVLLYVAHLLSDYPLQTDQQASCKADKTAAGWRANMLHAGTHVLVSAVVLAIGALPLDLNLDTPTAIAGLLWIGASHSLIDRRWPIRWWMEHTGQKVFMQHGGMAHVDQTAHVTALLIAALALAA